MLNSRLVILPYKPGSRSARHLAIALTAKLGSRVRRVRPDGRYRPKGRSLVVNYGFSGLLPPWAHLGKWLNPKTYVTNKLYAFTKFKEVGIPTPEWTNQREVVQQWIAAKRIVVCRTLLNAHSGRGIIVANTVQMMPIHCPLYVLYKKKRSEFRVHVFNGSVIDVSEKRRRRNGNNFDNSNNGLVRNLANGWVFCRDGVVEPPDLRDLACRAVAALGLNFGACDIIWNEKENKCYVLEVNTAPGLEGTTLQRYADAIVKWVKSNG